LKLLFDQNLSRRLTVDLADRFPDSRHVVHIGLDRASDLAIWEFAAANGYVVVSKDSDFRDLSLTIGPPPKTIVIATGNATTKHVADLLRTHADAVLAFGESDDALLVLG
jgi:predicted nuclease of predicted toxin-antitoxin system